VVGRNPIDVEAIWYLPEECFKVNVVDEDYMEIIPLSEIYVLGVSIHHYGRRRELIITINGSKCPHQNIVLKRVSSVNLMSATVNVLAQRNFNTSVLFSAIPVVLERIDVYRVEGGYSVFIRAR